MAARSHVPLPVIDERGLPDSTDDDALVARARGGEPRAFDLLVERHHAAVYRRTLAILGDGDRAADATQDAFVKAFRALDGWRGEASFRSWLLSIAANEAKDAIRKAGRRRETHLDDAAPLAAAGADPGERAVVRDEASRVRRALEGLPEKQRMAVKLRIDEGLSFREVGELIGSSEGAARVNYHHGIRRLRDMLDG